MFAFKKVQKQPGKDLVAEIGGLSSGHRLKFRVFPWCFGSLKLIIYNSLTRILGKKVYLPLDLHSSMKLITSILLFVFSLTVTLPVAQALLAKNQITLFVVDEEKSSSNELNETKEEKKDISNQFYLSDIAIQSALSLDLFCLNQAKIPTAPLMEKTTPPPNFC